MKSITILTITPLLAILSLASCILLPPPQHPIVGSWHYKHNGQQFTRKFTPDGKCILFKQGKRAWTHDYQIVDDTHISVTKLDRKQYQHAIMRDGRLNIEDRFIATRSSD